MMALVSRSFGRVVRVFAAMLFLLALFQIALIAVAASYANASTLDQLAQLVPGAVQQVFGPALLSFGAMTTLGYFHPIPVMAVVQFAIYVATEPAGEIEWGLVDVVLARPLPRHWLVNRSLIVVTVSVALLTLTMGAATSIGLWMLAPPRTRWPEPRVVLLLIVHLATVAWCFGGAALAATGWARRRGSAQAPIAIAAVALYLLDLLGASWQAARPFARLSPFHYYQGAAILAGTANAALDLSILGAAGGVGIALAYWQFSRRDL
jgi:hypothetical protein